MLDLIPGVVDQACLSLGVKMSAGVDILQRALAASIVCDLPPRQATLKRAVRPFIKLRRSVGHPISIIRCTLDFS